MQDVQQEVMRRTPRDLDEGEKYNVDLIKQMGETFVSRCDSIGSSREMSLAKTKMEEAVMWAVKAITK